jgi:hypothetical protein
MAATDTSTVQIGTYGNVQQTNVSFVACSYLSLVCSCLVTCAGC